MNTRTTDEELLIKFVKDQGPDRPKLIAAARRLKKAIKKGLQDYAIKDIHETRKKRL